MFCGIQTGKGFKIPLIAVIDIYIIYFIVNFPGLAISPIMNKLAEIFPHTSHLEIQMIYMAPNIACIPFTFVGGWLATHYNKITVINICCVVYAAAGIAFFFVDSVMMLIVLSVIVGIAGGTISPISISIVTDVFKGRKRSFQLGLTSAIMNLVLIGTNIGTGYIAEINWHYPFFLYVVPVIPILLCWSLGKYLSEPTKASIAAAEAKKAEAKKNTDGGFRKNVNVPALIRYSIYYFYLSAVMAIVSLYMPFMVKSSGTAGDLTSVMFLSVFLAGLVLNQMMDLFKGTILWVVMIALAIGYLLIVITHSPVIMGIGIFIAAFFCGVAQPYCYDKVSYLATTQYVPLAQSWLIIACSTGGVISPFVFSGINKVFHYSSSQHPSFPFLLGLVSAVIVTVFVIFYYIWRDARNHEHKKKVAEAEAAAKAAGKEPVQPAVAVVGHRHPNPQLSK